MNNIPDKETQRRILRKEVRKIRDNPDKAPFYAKTKSPSSRGLEEAAGGNGLYQTPASFLEEDLKLKYIKTKGVRTNSKGFASNFDELAAAYKDIAHAAVGTPYLSTICDILMDGCMVAKFSGGLGSSKEDCKGMMASFAGGHGPFYVIMNKDMMTFEESQSRKAKKYKAYSLAVVTHIALPTEAHKKRVLKVLDHAVGQEFITIREYDEVALKVLTYDEVIAKTKKPKKAKKARPKAIGGELKKLMNAPPGSRKNVDLRSKRKKEKTTKGN